MNKRVIHLRYLSLISVFLGIYVGTIAALAGCGIGDICLYSSSTIISFLLVVMFIDTKVSV